MTGFEEEGLLFADGFGEAIMGVVQQFAQRMVCYDRAKCIEILMERDGMEEDEAIEFFDFNVQGAWVGEHTPAFFIYGKPPK